MTPNLLATSDAPSGMRTFPQWLSRARARRWVRLGILWLVCGTAVTALRADPTATRSWTATSGHRLEAKALQLKDGQVQMEKPDGAKIVVPLAKLSDEDQQFLRKHFQADDAPAAPAGKTPATPEGQAADDLPHPLGETTNEIPCGGGFDYFLHLPKSLQKGAKHPVLFVMNPGGGGKDTVNRYLPGAERNRWIIAVSKQSKNGFEGSTSAVDAMIKHACDSLPIDRKRIYVSGFSGGSRMAWATSQKHKDIAGVIACGAGGGIGSAKQTVYGLCGSNCFNRTDMANAFKPLKGKDNILRYFVGQHAWAEAELCDDAITHLNGVFLLANRAKYPAEGAFYQQQVGSLIAECQSSSPLRATMWAAFLTDRGAADAAVTASYAALIKDPINKLYLKGLADVNKFAQKTFGEISASQWQADPKIAAACKREALKYAGTPWQEILTKMADDAEKF